MKIQPLKIPLQNYHCHDIADGEFQFTLNIGNYYPIMQIKGLCGGLLLHLP